MMVIEKKALDNFKQLDEYINLHGRQPKNQVRGEPTTDGEKLVSRLKYYFSGLPKAMEYRQLFVDHMRYCPACGVAWKGGFSCWCGFNISRLEIEEQNERVYLRILGKQKKKLIKRTILSFDRAYEKYMNEMKEVRKKYIEMLLGPDHKDALLEYRRDCDRVFTEYIEKIDKMTLTPL